MSLLNRPLAALVWGCLWGTRGPGTAKDPQGIHRAQGKPPSGRLPRKLHSSPSDISVIIEIKLKWPLILKKEPESLLLAFWALTALPSALTALKRLHLVGGPHL